MAVTREGGVRTRSDCGKPGRSDLRVFATKMSLNKENHLTRDTRSGAVMRDLLAYLNQPTEPAEFDDFAAKLVIVATGCTPEIERYRAAHNITAEGLIPPGDVRCWSGNSVLRSESRTFLMNLADMLDDAFGTEEEESGDEGESINHERDI
ncbi:hypothetical protein [Schlesneria sp. DSM 10557]|uniref:hypothetical protein n=1 Tax=Schlesneria sp. DSM 10557 TaxID=3044399 RepID=UPI0035A024BD